MGKVWRILGAVTEAEEKAYREAARAAAYQPNKLLDRLRAAGKVRKFVPERSTRIPAVYGVAEMAVSAGLVPPGSCVFRGQLVNPSARRWFGQPDRGEEA